MVTMWRIVLTFATTLAFVTTASAFSVAPVARSPSQWPALSSPLFQKKLISSVRALESSVVAPTNSAIDSPATLGPIASAMTKVCRILEKHVLEYMHVKSMIISWCELLRLSPPSTCTDQLTIVFTVHRWEWWLSLLVCALHCLWPWYPSSCSTKPSL